MTEYNGWPNRATWNVTLWLGNHEQTYRVMLARFDRHRVGKRSVINMLHAIFPTGRTPDGYRVGDVDVDRVVEFVREHVG
jgi:hypothetical protein